jgi:hypothetical protein
MRPWKTRGRKMKAKGSGIDDIPEITGLDRKVISNLWKMN